ncbi:unnamed protein product [Discula destructiva]
MEPSSPLQDAHSPKSVAHEQQPPPRQQQPIHRRNSAGGGLFSKLSFSRSGSDQQKQHRHDLSPRSVDETRNGGSTDSTPTAAPLARQPPSIANALQQQKTRRRRGSLRKVALLGRGAQRERREAHRANLSIDVREAEAYGNEKVPTNPDSTNFTAAPQEESSGFGLGISDITPRPSMDGYAKQTTPGNAPAVAAASLLPTTIGLRKPKVEIDEPTPTSPTISYTTTDDEDGLHIRRPTSSRGGPELASLSSGSDSFFGRVEPLRRRTTTISRARSPLIAATSLLSVEDDWDYAETEWWGWVILIVTWVVFVVGMGSVFGVWSWAWDVGTTPYAPPELEDDPTLPITGYYPCLIILTCVMAWVWVVSAWVGMKYFRHAKISGD